MTRKTLIASITYAGYHNDTNTGTRLLIENRISKQRYDIAFNQGRHQKINGVKCSCTNCNKELSS